MHLFERLRSSIPSLALTRGKALRFFSEVEFDTSLFPAIALGYCFFHFNGGQGVVAKI